MGLAANYFRAWLNGHTQHQAMPDPPTQEEARPFVVRLSVPARRIPLNVLVFARDAEHAKRRVVLALEECCEKDYRGREGGTTGPGRQYELLDQMRDEALTLEVAPFDIAMMPAVQWANNGGL